MTSANVPKPLKLLVCVVGIYGAYMTQGAVQDILSTSTFGPQKERFPHLSTLHALQSWTCFLWAFLLLRITNHSRQATHQPAPVLGYWKAGLSNSIGPALGLHALKYISYPAQVLAKSSKMIPVMIMGTILHGKRYSLLDYMCCSLVTVGISMFAMNSSSKAASKLASPNAPLGYLLCAMNLMLDGYTNAYQDELKRLYPKGTAIEMMCWMNFWTGAFNIIPMFILSTAGRDVIMFCMLHSSALYNLLLFCLCGAIGQLFIFFTITTFGSLNNTLITTTRKFFSILLSVVLTGHALLAQQWIAVAMVFAGLLVSSITKHRRHVAAKKKTA